MTGKIWCAVVGREEINNSIFTTYETLAYPREVKEFYKNAGIKGKNMWVWNWWKMKNYFYQKYDL